MNKNDDDDDDDEAARYKHAISGVKHRDLHR